MPYISVSDLEDAMSPRDLIGLLDDDTVNADISIQAIFDAVASGTEASLSEEEQKALDRMKRFIARAESTVDSFLTKRFTVPLATVPQSISDATLTIVRHKLHLRRGGMPDDLRLDYNAVMRWLRDLAEGEVDLPMGDVDENDDVASSGLGSSDDMYFNGQIW